MSPGKLRRRILLDRVSWIRTMLEKTRALPLDSLEQFLADDRNAASAESFLRRALEALLDLGRHVLAKGFGIGTIEYKAITTELGQLGILNQEQVRVFRKMAGYRNRLTHFYEEVAAEELYEICTTHLQDIEIILDSLLTWVRDHPERLDKKL
jgi:uncharacterized protein YutE (UPF0331/DUF86 family)